MIILSEVYTQRIINGEGHWRNIVFASPNVAAAAIARLTS